MMDSILYNIRVNPRAYGKTYMKNLFSDEMKKIHAVNIGGRDVYVNDAVRDLISSHPAFSNSVFAPPPADYFEPMNYILDECEDLPKQLWGRFPRKGEGMEISKVKVGQKVKVHAYEHNGDEGLVHGIEGMNVEVTVGNAPSFTVHPRQIDLIEDVFTDRDLIEKKIDDSFRHLNSKMVDVISFRNRMNENFSTLDKRIHSAIERNKFIEKQNEELIKECRRKDVDIAHLNERNTSLLKSYQHEENQRRDWKEKADKANTRSLIFFLVGLGIAVSWFILR